VILSKLLINQVANYLTRHFKLDKMRDYVFEDNELDDKVKKLEKDVELLKGIAHTPKDFKCNYKIEEENKNG
jgi:hypothetical protein